VGAELSATGAAACAWITPEEQTASAKQSAITNTTIHDFLKNISPPPYVSC
jgi:hypothetical protein